jgi:hypothetical protein
MRKTFVLLFALATSMLVLNAQQSYEATAKLDKKISGSCVSIKVKANVKNAQKIMEDILKQEGLKGGKSSGKKIAYETPIMFNAISPNYINLFVTFEETSKDNVNPITTVNVFVSKGAEAAFESAGTDPNLIVNVKNFLDQKYATAVYNNDIAMKIEEKTKEIEKTNKELVSLQKHIENRTKDISSYEKDIEKAKLNIEKAKSDIETDKKSIETQNQVLSRQNEELRQLK